MGYMESGLTQLTEKIKRAGEGDSVNEDLLKILLEMAVVIDDLTDAVDELDMRLLEIEAEDDPKE